MAGMHVRKSGHGRRAFLRKVGMLVTGTAIGARNFWNNFTARLTTEHGVATKALSLVVADVADVDRPVFAGPSVDDQNFEISVAISPIDVGALFTGATGFEFVGSWPAGIEIHPTTGVISGTPTEEFANPNAAVRATNAGGVQDSNYLSVVVINSTSALANLIGNSRLGPAYTPFFGSHDYIWDWDFTAVTPGAVTNKTLTAEGGYQLELTCTAPSRAIMRVWGWNKLGFEAGVKYTMIAEISNDATSTQAIVDPFTWLWESGPNGLQGVQTIHSKDNTVAIGTTKRCSMVFSWSAGASITPDFRILPTTGNTIKATFKNPMIVKGDFSNPNALPAYVPTGPVIDATHMTVRDNGTTGKTVISREFGFCTNFQGMPQYNVTLSRQYPLYWSPWPASPRFISGSHRWFMGWGNAIETSPGVFNHDVDNRVGLNKVRGATVSKAQGQPFIVVPGYGPPSFYESWGSGAPKDVTKWKPYIANLLETFVPLGCYAIEVFNEIGERFWGERTSAPTTNREWRAAAAFAAKLARQCRDAIDEYNAAHRTNILMFGSGEQSNFNVMCRLYSPRWTPTYGTGFLDTDTGGGVRMIDVLDAIPFHTYGDTGTGTQNIKSILEVHQWCAELGRPDMPVLASEGQGKSSDPSYMRRTLGFAAQCKLLLGMYASMLAYNGYGMYYYGWDDNAHGFYGSASWPPSQATNGTGTASWTSNYATLERKFNALRALVLEGGRKVYACRVRLSDMVIEILVGTTRGSATWWAMDETFTGA